MLWNSFTRQLIETSSHWRVIASAQAHGNIEGASESEESLTWASQQKFLHHGRLKERESARGLSSPPPAIQAVVSRRNDSRSHTTPLVTPIGPSRSRKSSPTKSVRASASQQKSAAGIGTTDSTEEDNLRPSRSISEAARLPVVGKQLREEPDEGDDSWHPLVMEDGDEAPYDNTYSVAGPATRSGADVLARFQRHEREKREENRYGDRQGAKKARSFMDRQSTAMNVPPIEEDESQTQSNRHVKIDKGKRARRQTEEDELSEDEGFEMMSASRARTLRVARPQSSARSALGAIAPGSERGIRPALQVDEDYLAIPLAQASHIYSTCMGRTAAARSSDPEPSTMFSEVNAFAKEIVATRAPHKVQIRQAWSNEACSKLIEYIENQNYGTSWSKIEKCSDPLLRGRDQVALKDKARNMKMDFLKTRLTLPINFQFIRLSRPQIAKLQSLGIMYSQEGMRYVGS